MGSNRWQRAVAAARRFALAPASARPMAALRIGLAAVLLAQAAETARALFVLPTAGPARPIVEAVLARGVPARAIVAALGAAYVAALLALLVGLFARPAAAIAWLTHAALTGGSPAAADAMAHLALLYLVWTPCGAALSLDARRRHGPCLPSPAARLGLRVLQVHLSAVYAASGIAKAIAPGWWNGDALSHALSGAERRAVDPAWIAAHPAIAAAAGWIVILVELGYPLLVWPRRTRRVWVAITVTLHLAIAALLGPAALGAVMTVLTVAAFGIPAEPVTPKR